MRSSHRAATSRVIPARRFRVENHRPFNFRLDFGFAFGGSPATPQHSKCADQQQSQRSGFGNGAGTRTGGDVVEIRPVGIPAKGASAAEREIGASRRCMRKSPRIRQCNFSIGWRTRPPTDVASIIVRALEQIILPGIKAQATEIVLDGLPARVPTESSILPSESTRITVSARP
jgi:hypothetical protein